MSDSPNQTRKIVIALLLLAGIVTIGVIWVMYLTGTGVRGFVLEGTNKREKVIIEGLSK